MLPKSDSTTSNFNGSSVSQFGSQMDFSRPILTNNDLNKKYQVYQVKSDNVVQGGVRHFLKHYKPNGDCALNFLLDRVPLFKWITKYNIKQNIICDIISGITVGIVHIPQSLAYTMLSGLPAYVGLYVSIFPVLIYVLFGTTRHLSIGTFAIPAIMTASCLYKYEGILYPAVSHAKEAANDLLSNSTYEYYTTSSAENTTMHMTTMTSQQYISNDPNDAKIQIAMSLSLLVGILQVAFGALHFGFVTKYLSDAIVTGFTTGAAFHIVLTQISSLLGYSVSKTKITFKFIGNCIELFKSIQKTNLAAVIISIVSIIFLYVIKEQVNHRFSKKMFMPVPIELLIVVFGTLFSYLFKFDQKFGVKTVGMLPLGIPAPEVPLVSLFPNLISDAISISIVTFAVNISLSKFFGKKYKYEISPNQELFSYGTGNILSAFFQGYPACASLSRCAILEATNSASQIYAVVSSILVIIVCLFLGPLFKTLPHACLASIIVVALKNMCLQVTQIPSVYRTSKLEALAWIFTFAGVMILDVDIGLYIGIGLSLIMVIFKTQRPRVTVLGNIPETEIYQPIDVCDQAFELNGIKIIRYEESVYYANVDNFKYQILKIVGIKPEDYLIQIKSLTDKKAKISKTTRSKKKQNKTDANVIEMQTNEKIIDEEISRILERIQIKHIIIDCSSFNFTDSMGVDAILQLKENYQQIGICLHLSFCKPDLLKIMNKKLFSTRFDFEFIYPTTHDAVHAIVDRCKLLSEDTSTGNIMVNCIENNAFSNDTSITVANTSQISLKENRKQYEGKDLSRF